MAVTSAVPIKGVAAGNDVSVYEALGQDKKKANPTPEPDTYDVTDDRHPSTDSGISNSHENTTRDSAVPNEGEAAENDVSAYEVPVCC